MNNRLFNENIALNNIKKGASNYIIDDTRSEVYKIQIQRKILSSLNNVELFPGDNGTLAYTEGLASGSGKALSDTLEDLFVDLTIEELIALLEAINALKELSLEELKEKLELLEEIYNIYPKLKEMISNLSEILYGLSDKDKGYYSGYIYTIAAIQVIPYSKVVKIPDTVIDTIKGTKFVSGMNKIDILYSDWKDCVVNYVSDSGEGDGVKVAGNDRCERFKGAFTDKNTILKNKNFVSTGKYYGKSKIYRDSKTGNYYYRDPAGVSGDVGHRHLEVFDKNGKHLGEVDPITGIIDYSKGKPERSIKNILK